MERAGIHGIIRLRLADRIIEWAGRVVRISDTLDPSTRTVGIIVAVDKPYAKAVPGKRPPLVKGMFVEVELRAKPVENRIVVPRAAIRAGRVLVVDADNRLRSKPVEIGFVQGDVAILSAGLTAGEQIVVSDLSPAIDGMLLKATQDPDLAQRLVREAMPQEVPQEMPNEAPK